MESIVQERIQKERKEIKAKKIKWVPEREELPQEEKNDEKTRGPELQKMPEEGEENEKVRESQSEKVAEPLPANKKRIEANKLSPEARSWSIYHIRS